ncbi:MAG: dynamin family protein [Candidatus Cloacimonadaceae bacterium]|nr:dynamin family protein [Candidatus Cloacimonadaceae bacterium]
MLRDLVSFQKKKNALIDLVDSVQSAVDSADKVLGLDNDVNSKNNPLAAYKKNLHLQRTKLVEEKFKILVLGEFSSGKSTFLNAILKQKIIPVAVKPTTATINIVKYADQPRVILHFLSDSSNHTKTREISINELKKYTTSLDEDADKFSQSIELVEIYFPSEYCKNSVEILDTPGLASTKSHHERVTLEYIPNGNACIFLLNPTQPLSKSERHYLRLIKNYIRKVFFVANKIDLVDEADEREEVITYLKEELAKELNCTTEIDVYPMSADMANKGDLIASGFQDFIKQLESFLLSDSMLNEYYYPTVIMLHETIQNLIDSVNIRLQGLEFSAEEFDDKISKLKPKFDQAKITLNETIDYISQRKSVIKNKVALSASNSYAQLNNNIASIIEKWEKDLDNLKNDLPSIIKENLMNSNFNINCVLQSEIDHLNEEVSLKYKYFLDDIDFIKKKLVIQSEPSLVVNQPIQITTDITPTYVPSKGMSVTVGFALGYLLGPVAVLVGWLGAFVFSKLGEENIRQRALTSISNQVTSKIEDYKWDSLLQFNAMIDKQLSEYTTQLAEQMNILFQGINDSITSIQQDRKKAERLIEDKKNRYRLEIKSLYDIATQIRDFQETMK